MQALRQMGAGLIYGLVSITLTIGGLSLALGEHIALPPPSPTFSLPAFPPTLSPSQPFIPTDTALPSPIPTTAVPPDSGCPHPSGWYVIIVQPGNTLLSIAAQYGVTPDQLAQANCLITQNIAPGYQLYVPIQPTSTVAFHCGPFPGWVFNYVVQPSDTLYHISVLFSTTVDALKFANCKLSNEILIGERLWVPNVPTITPGVTYIPDFSTSTEIPTEPLTLTPIDTDTPTTTFTASPTSTETRTPTVTPTATITPFPSATP